MVVCEWLKQMESRVNVYIIHISIEQVTLRIATKLRVKMIANGYVTLIEVFSGLAKNRDR